MDFITFSWKDINIYWYGTIIAAAVVCGLIISRLNVWLHKESFDIVVKIMVWGIPCSIAGARSVYVLQNMDYFGNRLSDIFRLWQGGLSVYGALVVFFLVCAVFFRKNHLPVLYWCDLIIPAVVFGLAVLQSANFMMQFSVGMPLGTDLPNDHTLAEYIEYRYRPSGFEGYLYFQPVALYQAAADFGIFVLAVFLTLLNRFFNLLAAGTVFLSTVFLLALSRFSLGFMYLGMNREAVLYPVQWLALFVMAATAAFYIENKYRRIGYCKVNKF